MVFSEKRPSVTSSLVDNAAVKTFCIGLGKRKRGVTAGFLSKG
jgi:hypothetical protein